MGLQYTPVHTLGKVPCLVSVEVLRVAVNVTPHALQPPVCLPSAAHREGEVSRHRILAIGWRDVLLPCARLGGPETEECDFDLALDEEVGAEDGEGGEEGQQVSQHDDLLVTRSEDPNEVSAFLQVEQRQLQLPLHECHAGPVCHPLTLSREIVKLGVVVIDVQQVLHHGRLQHRTAMHDLEFDLATPPEHVRSESLQPGAEPVELLVDLLRQVIKQHKQIPVAVEHLEALPVGLYGHPQHIAVAVLTEELARPAGCCAQVEHSGASGERSRPVRHERLQVVGEVGPIAVNRCRLFVCVQCGVVSISVSEVVHPLRVLGLPHRPLHCQQPRIRIVNRLKTGLPLVFDSPLLCVDVPVVLVRILTVDVHTRGRRTLLVLPLLLVVREAKRTHGVLDVIAVNAVPLLSSTC
mmetsp:Transcript_33134/g.82027  ORF Transcript_33134/g.82027 Transcript_33134/m.82027 type:complete len:409 (-) Transcript_33134:223-1449(-)